ncbi:MAG: FkbM family methyltransferase [Planctomycetes bacterium]|nr:FkbM family methyltransferase [Planctomycetota bacterium]
MRRKVRVSVLSNHGRGVLANTKNGLLVVEAGDFSVGRILLQKGEYDWKEIQWLKKCLGDQAQHMVIIGTHIGALLVPLSAHCQQVLGFEADKTNFELLNYNINLNNVENASVHNIAVGDSKQIVNVKRNILNTGNTSVEVSETRSDHSIEMTTLDDDVTYDHIDLMIMDIEGHELHALKGASACLEKTEKLFIEFAPEQLREHGTKPEDVLDVLSKNFQHMYIYGHNIDAYTVAEGNALVQQHMGGKGYLKNILYSKQPLSDDLLKA